MQVISYLVAATFLISPALVHADIITKKSNEITQFKHLSLPANQPYKSTDKTQKILDNFIHHQAEKYYITGIPLTIQCQNFNNNTPVTYNSGLQSRNGPPVNGGSLWQIGSNSKSFLAVVILQLEAENKLSIEDKVSDYLSEDQYPKWKNITIKQLLNMTSGIHDYANEEDDIPNQIEQNPRYLFTTDEILNSVKERDLWFKPGKNWSYSNTNYVLAGKIVETITGKSVAEEIRERIINPLKMHHTYFISSFPKENVPPKDQKSLMSGYFSANNAPHLPFGMDTLDYSLSWGNAAASITSTSSDLNHYVRELFNGNLVPNKQLAELITLVDEKGRPLPKGLNKAHPRGYGLGIRAEYLPRLKSVVYFHGGETFGFSSTWKYIVSTKASVIFTLNTSRKMDKGLKKFVNSVLNSLPKSCLSTA
ncbi:MAG: beta-lactamase family protein [Tatlockia sp.]|nr:beta-lactamase family protein [Tatlockia sp.]